MTPSDAHDSGSPSDHVARPFAIERPPAPDGVALLVCEGEFDISAADRFRAAVDGALQPPVRRLVLDLAEVPFMDSSMLKELLRAHGAMEANGGAVALVGLQPGVRRLLDLTRTTELFELTDDRDAALQRSGA